MRTRREDGPGEPTRTCMALLGMDDDDDDRDEGDDVPRPSCSAVAFLS